MIGAPRHFCTRMGLWDAPCPSPEYMNNSGTKYKEYTVFQRAKVEKDYLIIRREYYGIEQSVFDAVTEKITFIM